MATKAELKAELDALGLDYDPKSTKADLQEVLDELTHDDEISARERSAPRCPGCGRSRLDGHIHSGV